MPRWSDLLKIVLLAALLAIQFRGSDPAFGQGSPSRRPFSATTCELLPGGESTVISIAGPQTLHLADGRYVRLTEILVPPAQAIGFDPAAASIRYLNDMALGRKVEVKFGGTQRDRYGVYLGQVYVAGEAPIWLQESLVASGLAEVFPQPDNHACARRLLAVEAAAREGKRGHWGLAYFKVLQAGDSRLMFNLTQTYQIVGGTVSAAAESGGRITLHFGGVYKYGFTAVIDPSARKRLAGKQAVEEWEGMTLRVRGWMERRRGPSIPVALPEQIEFPEEDKKRGPEAIP
jgi:endonuclease YncB( thermonuclease family)